ncbi:hypothetical protein [Actinophytocola sp.]|uniref:hypothetical protein n=1 Tax=Actinophytocola sp. TaxID=1872138 RepID=UPI002EDA5D5A
MITQVPAAAARYRPTQQRNTTGFEYCYSAGWRAVWRRDGFVSLSNGALPGLGDPGTVTTKPLARNADTLGRHQVVGVRPGPQDETVAVEVDGAAAEMSP